MSESKLTEPDLDVKQLPVEVSIVLGNLSLSSEQISNFLSGKVIEIVGMEFPHAKAMVSGECFAEVELIEADSRPSLRILAKSNRK